MGKKFSLRYQKTELGKFSLHFPSCQNAYSGIFCEKEAEIRVKEETGRGEHA